MKLTMPLISNNFSFKISMADIIALIDFDCSRITTHNENKLTKNIQQISYSNY